MDLAINDPSVEHNVGARRSKFTQIQDGKVKEAAGFFDSATLSALLQRVRL